MSPGPRGRLKPNMPKFMYVFRGGAFVTPGLSPTEMQAHLVKWYEWAGVLAEQGRHTGARPKEAKKQ